MCARERVCVREIERESVCVCEREREREREIYRESVCEREIERERHLGGSGGLALSAGLLLGAHARIRRTHHLVHRCHLPPAFSVQLGSGLEGVFHESSHLCKVTFCQVTL